MPWYDTPGKMRRSCQFAIHTIPPHSGWVVPAIREFQAHSPQRTTTISLSPLLHILPALAMGISKIFGGPGQDKHPRGLRHLHFDRGSNLSTSRRRANSVQYWSLAEPRFDEPFRTSHGSLADTAFPFTFPIPGISEQTLDYSDLLADFLFSRYDIHNACVRALQSFDPRELSKSTVQTLAYVGTQGHKLIAQYDANPGRNRSAMSPTQGNRCNT